MYQLSYKHSGGVGSSGPQKTCYRDGSLQPKRLITTTKNQPTSKAKPCKWRAHLKYINHFKVSQLSDVGQQKNMKSQQNFHVGGP